jgi:hypothetical protein
MEIALSTNLNKDELQRINNCRLYLQVTFLSEITSGDGTKLLQEAYNGDTDDEDRPVLWQMGSSTMEWPPQKKP